MVAHEGDCQGGPVGRLELPIRAICAYGFSQGASRIHMQIQGLVVLPNLTLPA